jgi:integrase
LAGAVRYVRTREGVFQYERRVPESVRALPAFDTLFGAKPLFRRSLRTKIQKEMYAAADRVHLEFEDLVAEALGRPKTKPSLLPAPLRKVTDQDIEDIAARYEQATARPFLLASLKADSEPAYAAELERLRYDLETYAEENSKVLRERGAASTPSSIESPVELARYVIKRDGYDADEGSPQFGAIVAAIRAGKERGYRRINALESGELLPLLPVKEAEEPSARLTIRQAIENYLAHRTFPAKTVSEVNLSLRTFESIVGNKAVDALARSDFQNFVAHLASQTVGGKSKESIKRPMALQTVKKRLGFFNAAINHAMDRGAFEGPNPASNIKVEAWVRKADPAVTPEKRPFKIGELNAIFRHPWFTGCKSADATHQPGSHRLKGAEYWVPVVALWTGCRASELGGLRLAEVMIDDPHPHFAVRDNEYRSTKGGYARDIPILDGLLELGFADYVERIKDSGADRLFPDWVSPRRTGIFNKDDAAWSNAKLIRAFNRTVVPSTLSHLLVAGARRAVTFHSFRGAFKSMIGLSENRPHHNIVKEVIGHSKTDLDQRYEGTIPIEETYSAIRSCKFKGLEIPVAP